jgi:hypothetical protein
MELEPKVCPDCTKEGKGEPQEPDAFYIHKRRKKDGSTYYFLSTYCKKHQSMRNVIRQAERLASSDTARQKKRAANQRYAKKHRPQLAAYLRDWRARNPDRTAEHYKVHRCWVERNPQKRRASQVAWYKKVKQRQDRGES